MQPQDLMNKFIVYCCILFIAGCATPTQKQFTALNERHVCCDSMAEFNYKKLDIGKKIKVNLTNESPVYDFAGYKTYFEAFSLPGVKDYLVHIKSYFNGITIGQYLDPVFLVLNKDLEPIESFTLILNFEEGEFFGDPDARMTGSFKLSEASKYLIIFAGGFKKTSRSADVSPSFSVIMVGSIPVVLHSPNHSIELEKAPTGKIKIEILPL
jgi:hypothetical protein